MQKRNLETHRMTGDEMSWLILSQEAIEFDSAEQFYAWLFVLNFGVLKHHLYATTKVNLHTRDKLHVSHDFPFPITIKPSGVDYEKSFVMGLIPRKNDDGAINIIGFSLPYTSAEARMVIKAIREKSV